MEKIVLANWKASLSPERAEAWIDEFIRLYTPVSGIKVILAVPFLSMERCREKLRQLGGVSLAAQGVSPYPMGSYTGATPASWLTELAEYAVIGHRERRRYFHETVQDVARQVWETIDADLHPIVCLDKDDFSAQIAAIDNPDLDKTIFAFTPRDATQLEIARNLEEIKETASLLKKLSLGRPVLYGGGVNRENAAALLALPELAGIMVGKSCLDVRGFLEILRG